MMWAAVRWASGPSSWFTKGPLQFAKMIAISVPSIAFVAPPALVVLVALLVAAAAEWIVYLPLRVLRRDRTKRVNAPKGEDVLMS